MNSPLNWLAVIMVAVAFVALWKKGYFLREVPPIEEPVVPQMSNTDLMNAIEEFMELCEANIPDHIKVIRNKNRFLIFKGNEIIGFNLEGQHDASDSYRPVRYRRNKQQKQQNQPKQQKQPVYHPTVLTDPETGETVRL